MEDGDFSPSHLAEFEEMKDEDDYARFIETVTGLEDHILQIEEWLNRKIFDISENKPLVIKADEGSGKKTLLVKWKDYHQQNSTNVLFITKFEDIIIMHFASSGKKSSNYFYAIYRILIQLREALDLDQKVELLEEKLRRYFGYWLEVANRRLHDHIVNDAKILLIFEGIDKFYEPNSSDLFSLQTANIAFWLPKFFPDRVRVIVTCEGNSPAYSYFQSMECPVIELKGRAEISDFVVQYYKTRKLFVRGKAKERHFGILEGFSDELKSNYNFTKAFLTTLLPYPSQKIVKLSDVKEIPWDTFFDDLDYEKLKAVKTTPDFYDFIMTYFSRKLMNEEKFKKLLLVFAISEKGLSESEIMSFVKIKQSEWNVTKAIFKGFLLNYKDIYQIVKGSFKQAILQVFGSDPQTLIQIHEEIASVLEKTPISVRQLEEQTLHLYNSRSYFKLKETVSIIENFLLLFNANTKYTLCRYWQTLEENGFDPAIEYNKAVEGFDMHYHPSSEDIFSIILQVSRFLNEFSDFETNITPKYRHPPITATIKELSDIGLYKEVKKCKLFTAYNPNLRPNILTELESRNIEMPNNREIVRNHFMKEIKDEVFQEEGTFREKFEGKRDEIPVKNEENVNKNVGSPGLRSPINKTTEEDEELSKEDSFQSSSQDPGAQRKPRKDEDCHFLVPEEERIRLKAIGNEKHYQKYQVPKGVERTDGKEATFYYYKRWLWMVFPWACISQNDKCDYSVQMKKCFTSSTKYMSVIAERQFTQRALKIALEAKLKKQALYSKEGELELQVQTLNTMKKNLKTLDKYPAPKDISEGLLRYLDERLRSKKKIEQQDDSQGFPAMTFGSAFESNQSRLHKVSHKEEQQLIMLKSIDPAMKKPSKRATKFLPDLILSKNTFLTELQEPSKQQSLLNLKSVSKSKTLMSRFRLSDGSKILDTMQSSIQKKNSSSISVLPKLKESILAQNSKALKALDDQVRDLQKEYDGLNDRNDILESQLEKLKTIYQSNGGLVKTQETKEYLSRRDLEEFIGKIEGQFQFTKKEKARIEKIVNICQKNKYQNEEWIRDLNFLLQNYNKLVHMETKDIKKEKEAIISLRKIAFKYISAFEEKSDHHCDLLDNIKRSLLNKMAFTDNFRQTDEIFRKSAESEMSRLRETSRNKQNKSGLQKKASTIERIKSMNEKIEEMNAFYLKLEKTVKDKDLDFVKSAEFQRFKVLNEKNTELKEAIIDREDRVAVIRDQIARKKKILESLIAKENWKEQVEGQPKLTNNLLQSLLQEEDRKYDFLVIDFMKLKKTQLNCLMMCNTFMQKLQSELSYTKLKDLNPENLINLALLRLYKIKERISEEDYARFQSGIINFMNGLKDLTGKKEG